MKIQALPNMELSEEDIVNNALSEKLETKIKKAIGLLQMYEPFAIDMSEDGFSVRDSFGKDSDCIVKLAELAGVKHKCYHSLTTIDPPELIKFGKKHHPNTIIERPPKHFMTRMVEKMMIPSRMFRWCCAEYKENSDKSKLQVVGVRVSESSRRAKIWKQVIKNDTFGFVLAPIAYWTDDDVWEFHKRFKLPYCCLYDEGFHRLGCVGCPLTGKRQREIEFSRWPKYKEMWQKAFQKMFDDKKLNRKGEKYQIHKFNSVEDIWSWWMEEDGEDEDCTTADMFKGVQ